MKNQNDLIFSIVFAVLGLIACGVAFATKPEVPTIPAPTPINIADAPLPTGTDTAMGNALPNGGGGAAGGGGFGGPGGFSGPPGGFPGGRGMSGMPGGMGGPPMPMGMAGAGGGRGK